MLHHRSVSRVLQKTPEMHEQSRLSGQFDSCLFYYIYFLINKGKSVTSNIFFFFLSCLFNDFGLKFLLQSAHMHEIDYTFFLSFFFPQSNLEEVGGGGGMHYINLV